MDNTAIITFEKLYEILKKEKLGEELQKLDKTFMADLANYLRTKKTILESQKSKESIFASAEIEKTTKQIQNTLKMIRELYERRETKIVHAALLSARTDKQYLDASTMLPEELQFFSHLMAILSNQRESVLNRLLEAELPALKEQPQSLKREEEQALEGYVAVADVPQFVFSDMNIYGPFIKGQGLEVPEEVAQFLMQKKQVEKTSKG